MPPLRMTVASVDTSNPLDLRREVGLLKAALLYADEIHLASPKLGLLARLSDESVAGEKLPTVEQLQTPPPGRAWAVGAPAGRLSFDERRLVKKFENQLLLLSAQQALAVANGVSIVAPAAAEIELALRARVVELDPVGSYFGPGGFLRESVVVRLEDLMAASLERGSTIYPLFDEAAWEMTRELVLQGRVHDPHYGFARQAGVAEHLLAALVRGVSASPNGCDPRRA